MIKSMHFWLAAICISIIPLLLIDITQHRLDWQKEVREETITVVQNVYSFSRQQKAEILDRIFERNQTLIFLLYSKCLAGIFLLGVGFYFFRRYRRYHHLGFWKPAFITAVLMISFIVLKIYVVNAINRNRDIQFVTFNANDASLLDLYNRYFRGKVVYVDFWGTTCGPCLQEFRDFTRPLKEKYKFRRDIAWLYIAQGNQYLWRQQIKKYAVEGYHVFTTDDQYEKLYRQSTKDTGIITMPRYLIIDKRANIASTQAKQPSDKDALYAQLDECLLQSDQNK